LGSKVAAFVAAGAVLVPTGAHASDLGNSSTSEESLNAGTRSAQIASLRRMVSQVRRQHGLRALRASARLNRSAALRATAIGRCGQISHTPCGQSFIGVFRSVGYARGRFAVGENLAWGTGSLGSPESAVRGWLHSPPHRAALLSGRWRDIGIAYAVGPGGGALWVAQFGRRG
jgi:uncharacterized protein YkwD